jgi:hypothetical protein
MAILVKYLYTRLIMYKTPEQLNYTDVILKASTIPCDKKNI